MPATEEAAPKSASTVKEMMKNTKICAFHVRGLCKFGKQCSFAHECDQLMPLPPVVRKTRLCQNHQGGKCADRNCSFAHSKAELVDTFYKTALCVLNRKGMCTQGSQCRFAHSLAEKRPAQGTAQDPQSRPPTTTTPPAKAASGQGTATAAGRRSAGNRGAAKEGTRACGVAESDPPHALASKKAAVGPRPAAVAGNAALDLPAKACAALSEIAATADEFMSTASLSTWSSPSLAGAGLQERMATDFSSSEFESDSCSWSGASVTALEPEAMIIGGAPGLELERNGLSLEAFTLALASEPKVASRLLPSMIAEMMTLSSHQVGDEERLLGSHVETAKAVEEHLPHDRKGALRHLPMKLHVVGGRVCAQFAMSECSISSSFSWDAVDVATPALLL